MRTKVIINNREYLGKESKDNLGDAAEAIYEAIDKANKFKLNLDNGGVLILCKEMLQKAEIILLP